MPAKTASKAKWIEVGDKKIFARSRWEANYARYLEHLKQSKEIADWRHEGSTFWFEKIKRGVRSYLPDFDVFRNDGSVEHHEVKGFMDNKSFTKIKRMRIYHPDVNLVLVDPIVYGNIERTIGRGINGWEE